MAQHFGLLLISRAMGGDDDQVGAQFVSPCHRHGRMDAQLPGGVGAGGDHPAPVRIAAHRKGVTA